METFNCNGCLRIKSVNIFEALQVLLARMKGQIKCYLLGHGCLAGSMLSWQNRGLFAALGSRHLGAYECEGTMNISYGSMWLHTREICMEWPKVLSKEVSKSKQREAGDTTGSVGSEESST